MITEELPEPFLSFEPLIDMYKDADGNIIYKIVAEAIGCSSKAIIQWRRSGVSVKTAESIAERIGFHPFDIWGSDYYAAIYYQDLRSEFRIRLKAENRKNKKRTNKSAV